VALFFMYGKVGVLAALYYLDATLFGWYAAYCVGAWLFPSFPRSRSSSPRTLTLIARAVLFAGVGHPVYSGPSKLRMLNPALVERLITRAKTPAARNWLVYFYAEWSDYCLEHDAMVAELSLTYSSEALQFGRVDLNQWTDLATTYNIDVSATSWQLPTLILFQDGKEAVRLPQFDAKDKIIKTVLHRVRLTVAVELVGGRVEVSHCLLLSCVVVQAGIVAVFHLDELKEGKSVEFKSKSA